MSLRPPAGKAPCLSFPSRKWRWQLCHIPQAQQQHPKNGAAPRYLRARICCGALGSYFKAQLINLSVTNSHTLRRAGESIILWYFQNASIPEITLPASSPREYPTCLWRSDNQEHHDPPGINPVTRPSAPAPATGAAALTLLFPGNCHKAARIS